MCRRHVLFAVAVVVLALPNTASARTIAVDAADSGTTVLARPGDRIRVTLDANETTGFRWRVTARPRPAVARLTRSRYVAEPTDRIGSGGVQQYLVRARGQGRTRLAAVYRQVGSDDLGGRFRISIRVVPRLS